MDLTTTYLGMTLRTPLVASASPLSEEIDTIRRMEDAGISAVVLHSLFAADACSNSPSTSVGYATGFSMGAVPHAPLTNTGSGVTNSLALFAMEMRKWPGW